MSVVVTMVVAVRLGLVNAAPGTDDANGVRHRSGIFVLLSFAVRGRTPLGPPAAVPRETRRDDRSPDTRSWCRGFCLICGDGQPKLLPSVIDWPDMAFCARSVIALAVSRLDSAPTSFLPE